MTILIEQPEFGLQVEEKRVPFNANELILDGGFVVPNTLSSHNDDEIFEVPNINAFGQSFRDYNAESERQKT
ncbi:hypothetical protein FXO38_23399, partial [Capsicum annuum]